MKVHFFFGPTFRRPNTFWNQLTFCEDDVKKKRETEREREKKN